ncbi:MAG: 6-phosphogluconolactonase [Minicystis sp.]
MNLEICESASALGQKAALEGAELIRDALRRRGEANIIVASGASQFEMLENLVTSGGIAWHGVTGFHLDEYIGLPIEHPASFRLYMWQRFVKKLPLPLKAFHYIDARPRSGDGAAAGRGDHRAAPDRRGVRGDRREWPYRLQRAAR